jgi:hypothetical protein
MAVLSLNNKSSVVQSVEPDHKPLKLFQQALRAARDESH